MGTTPPGRTEVWMPDESPERHWLEIARDRIFSGEPESDVMESYGYSLTVDELTGVEQGVPIPDKEFRSVTPRYKYPFNHMAPGDSFLIPCFGDAAVTVKHRVRNAARMASAHTGAEFTVLLVRGGVRVWRD